MKLTLCFALMALLLTETARAGGGGVNVVVVVNQNSSNSLALANDYCEARAIPPRNLLRLTGWTGGSINWTPAQFTNYLLNPLLNLVHTGALSNQAQFVVLSMDIPYRVTDGSNENSTTSALFYGFKTNGAPVVNFASCSLPDATSNSYAFTEMPFPQAPPDTASTNSFLAMMLTDTNLARAENTLRSGVSADSTFPTQPVYLEETTDNARNVRFVEADNSVFENQVIGNYAVQRLISNNTTFTNLFGLQTGFGNFTLAPNTFVPGAIGDSLTSLGGEILESGGQTTLLTFLNSGGAGSYGAVVEPCNYLEKFPDAVDYFYQARGFSLAEAYYQSVLNPFEGLVVGEPLSAPFARPGTGAWTTPTNNAPLAGSAPLDVTFTAAATNLPLTQADLFVDGAFYQTMTNLPPAPGNILTATLNGVPVSYTVATNDTLATIAEGLADALNLQTNLTDVLAYPVGDRIELQSQSLTTPGSNVTLTAASAGGTAAQATTQLRAARPAFLDTIATGYHFVQMANNPVVGDWIQFTFTKTNGAVISLAVTNTTSLTLGAMVENLMSQMSSTPALATADGVTVSNLYDGGSFVQYYFFAHTPGCLAAQLTVAVTTSSNLVVYPTGTYPLADNLPDLLPRNHLYISSGLAALPVTFNLDTTTLADGWHQLLAVAYEGTSVRTQTRAARTVQVQNTPLAASLAALPVGSNVTLLQPLQFTVTTTAATNITQITLFTAGGAVAAATNQSAANFVLNSTNLGMGLHPFYAVITDAAGHQYQTPTIQYRSVPAAQFLTNATLLTSSENPAGFKDSLGFTATVATNAVPAANATGTVQFLTNGVAFGDAVSVTNGIATLATALLPRGTNSLAAAYSGDVNYLPSLSPALAEIVTNHPPVAALYTVVRNAGGDLHILWADVATNWTDVDGDPVTLAGLNLTTTNGVTLATNATQIDYPISPNVDDQIAYVITDGQGGTNAGFINILINPFVTGQYTGALTVGGSNVTLDFFGITNYTYEVQRSTNLVDWATISTNLPGTNGEFDVIDSFMDLGAPPPSAFYRLEWQP